VHPRTVYGMSLAGEGFSASRRSSSRERCNPRIEARRDRRLQGDVGRLKRASLPHHHPGGDLRGCRQRRAARTAPAWRPDRDKDRKVHRHENGVDACRKRIRRQDHLPSPLALPPDRYRAALRAVDCRPPRRERDSRPGVGRRPVARREARNRRINVHGEAGVRGNQSQSLSGPPQSGPNIPYGAHRRT
jgi:hypothetical protein